MGGWCSEVAGEMNRRMVYCGISDVRSAGIRMVWIVDV
jgi:hypothetical protein